MSQTPRHMTGPHEIDARSHEIDRTGPHEIDVTGHPAIHVTGLNKIDARDQAPEPGTKGLSKPCLQRIPRGRLWVGSQTGREGLKNEMLGYGHVQTMARCAVGRPPLVELVGISARAVGGRPGASRTMAANEHFGQGPPLKSFILLYPSICLHGIAWAQCQTIYRHVVAILPSSSPSILQTGLHPWHLTCRNAL